MIFTYEDQIQYTKLALALVDAEKTNLKSLEGILDFGEMVKKYADENNWLIYDVTEYVYEQLRLLRGDEGAYDDTELRAKLSEIIDDNKFPKTE